MKNINPSFFELKGEKLKSNSGAHKVGCFIKEARQGRNESTEKLAKELKIGEGQLIAIENGRTDLLPEKVFVRAMIRRISEKLGLDTEYIMEELESNNEEIKIKQGTNKLKNRKFLSKSEMSVFFNIIIILSGAMGLVISFLIFDIDYKEKIELKRVS